MDAQASACSAAFFAQIYRDPWGGTDNAMFAIAYSKFRRPAPLIVAKAVEPRLALTGASHACRTRSGSPHMDCGTVCQGSPIHSGVSRLQGLEQWVLAKMNMYWASPLQQLPSCHAPPRSYNHIPKLRLHLILTPTRRIWTLIESSSSIFAPSISLSLLS